eukprot:TRINITY_DN1099_c0_g1_i7.p3 TRINITY_DN1099_c0_g1~~TRINITY_DN1099_c0_g1_i7.p3  ORF type:complete len:214 (-),score=75.97 TRINITY_DN1099_c0_g1_i7:16-657(-)
MCIRDRQSTWGDIKMLFKTIVLIHLIFATVFCTNGVTIRDLVTDFKCLKEKHLAYAFVRALLNNGRIDPNARKTLQAAQAAKLLYYNAYINPCVNCRFTPEYQIDIVAKELDGIDYGMIWIMVQINDPWTPNQANNCVYLKRMIAETKKLNLTAGIGSDALWWEKIMGVDCVIEDYDVGLWWIKHDKEQHYDCLLYTSPSPRDLSTSRMPSSA